MNIKHIISLVYIFLSGFTFCQEINERLSLIQSIKIDTNELKNLYDNAWELLYSNPDSALILAEQHIQLSKKLENYNIEFGLYLKGTISLQLGNPKISLECYYDVLKLNEQKFDSLGIAKSYRYIGTVFNYMGEANKSKEFYEKAISFFKAKKEDIELAQTLNNYGIILMKSGEYEKGIRVLNEALSYKKRALKDSRNEKEKEKLETGIALLESNLGLIYMNQNKTNEALINLINATKIYSKYDNENYLGSSYFYLAKIYLSKNEKLMASKYANLAQDIADKTGYIELDRMASDISYQVSEKKGDYKKALSFLEKLMQLNDRIYSKENTKALHESEIKYQYEKKNKADSIMYAEEKRINEAELLLQDAKISSRRSLTKLFIIVLFVIVILSVVIWFRFQKSQDQKNIIQSQKNDVDQALADLKIKKEEIEHKNQEIIHSINYAKYIQKSMLPDKDELKGFFANHFIFNQPKDIVGGDFYWFKSFDDIAIIVAADCTGHGVPGGFITMLGNLLIENSIGFKVKNPDKILKELNRDIITFLKQDEVDSIQDGMDISICLIDKKKRKIKFSGARNGLFIVNGDDVKSIKGSVNPVGGVYTKKETFMERDYNLEEIKVHENDWFFMYTDGYYDQFGGEKGKSMGSKKFTQILIESINNKKTNTEFFKNKFDEWKSNKSQIDDVLIIGFKI